MEFYNREVWGEFIQKHYNSFSIPKAKKVKYHNLKYFMNKIFRTKFKLYEVEEKPVGKIKIRKFGE